MTKHFFITVPYFGENAKTSPSSLFNFGTPDTTQKAQGDSFESARIQLEQRVANVLQGLSRFGLRGQRLGTEEVVELFYKLFNPSEGDRAAPKVE